MMEGVAAGGVQQTQQQQPQPQVERLNEALQQQLNLEQVKTRAVSLFKAISRILEIIDVTARANAVPKWEAVLGQFSMVNLELFNIVDDIKKVSKAFVVYPKNVNAENANVLPVMLSSKLLPEMETDDNSKREQLLHGMQNLPISAQIDKLKTRIDMIAAACASAEKILADTRKTYGFGTRQGPAIASTLDKAQAAKIQEQENLLRAAVNLGEGLRVPPDQRHITSVLPLHLVDVLSTGDGAQSVTDTPGMYAKSTPPLSSNIMANQGALLQVQGSGAQLMGRSAASPSGPSFNNTTSPLPYANSPSSGTNMMNAPSPQQQTQQQQHQRQRMQMPQHQQQILAQQQQFRQVAMPGMGQTQLPQLHDLQSQTQQKLQQLHGQHAMQFSQPLTQQQFQNRQMASGHVQNVMGQAQLSQGNPLSRQMNQFSAGANAALYNAAQTTPNSQMMTNISGAMPSQSQLPRMQPYALSGTNPPRSHASQMMNDQMFNMGASNPAAMMQMQQQGAFGNMAANAQNLQAGMGAMQNTQQTHPNFQHQRPPNQ